MSEIVRRVLLSVIQIVIVAQLCGCTGTHLYNEANHEAATNAQSSFKQAKLSEALSEERKAMDAISTRELLVVRRQTLAIRDAEMIAIVGEKDSIRAAKQLLKSIDERLESIAGKTALNSLVSNSFEIKNKQRLKERAASSYMIGKKKDEPSLPTKSTDKNIPTLRAKISNKVQLAFFEAYIMHMAALEGLQATFGKDLSSDADSMLGRLTGQINEIEESQKALTDEVAQLKTAFDAEKKKYDAAVAVNNKNEVANAAKQLTNILNKLEFDKFGSVVEKLEDLGFGDLKLEAIIAKLEEEQKAVFGVVELLLNEKTATNSNQKITGKELPVYLVNLMPAIREQVGGKILHPSIQSLLLKQTQVALQLEAVKRRLNHGLARLSLLQKKRDYMLTEAFFLVVAQRNANQLVQTLSTSAQAIKDANFPKAIDGLSHVDAEVGADAIVNYSLSWTLGRVRQEECDYRTIAERHHAALDESEIALLQWENLIGIPLSQLVALHGSGIKPEIIANLISAAGISAAIGFK